VTSRSGTTRGDGSVILRWHAAAAPVAVEIDGSSSGVTLPLGRQVGTVCDPHHWARTGATSCSLAIAGRFTGDMTAPDSGAALGAVHGAYLGRLVVTTVVHSPVCLETRGTITYVLFDRRGRRLGSLTAKLDQSDSEICQQVGTTARTYFLRADPTSGTGIFAGADGGNVLVTGSGAVVSRRAGVYRNHLDVSVRVDSRR
jgi:hypothetical protein